MHLQKLSSEVESGLKADASIKDISSQAQKIIETQLIPDYSEFRRQIEAEKTGFWARMLQKGGDVMEIDATPATPKFWGQLIKALFGLIQEDLDKQKSILTNQQQAFRFMHLCEKTYKK